MTVSAEAMALVRESELIDLHLDSFIPPRVFGYDLHKAHGAAPFYGRLFGHLDFPRAYEGGLTGAMWSITTNPFRTERGRWEVFLENLAHLQSIVDATGGRAEVVKDHASYLAARRRGAHACLLAIQGGNALAAAPEGPASIPGDLITRVTLVHLTNSCYGATSAPFALWRGREGLSTKGKDFVRALNARRIFVDLAHINEQGFWDAVEVHDKSQPLIATHTGVSGVKKHWRNLDDRQVKAIADTGGTIGIIFSATFLATREGARDGAMVVEHMQHVIDVAGEDFVSIGSDFDGFIIPPKDLRSALGYPRLVQHMLDRGWSAERVKKVLGGNFLRAFESIRPGTRS